MKKRILAMTCAAVAAAAVPVYGAEETAAEHVQPAEETVATNLGVMVNEEPVVFSGQQPVIVDNVTLVPVRGVLETLGVTVAWDAQTHTITVKDGKPWTVMCSRQEIPVSRCLHLHRTSTVLP